MSNNIWYNIASSSQTSRQSTSNVQVNELSARKVSGHQDLKESRKPVNANGLLAFIFIFITFYRGMLPSQDGEPLPVVETCPAPAAHHLGAKEGGVVDLRCSGELSSCRMGINNMLPGQF